MRGFIARLTLAAAVLAIPARAAAQLPGGVVVGDTVRVAAPGLGPEIRGVVVSVAGDTMFVMRNGSTSPVWMSAVERVDVRRRHTGTAGVMKGIAYGAPIGLAAGLILGSAAKSDNGDCVADCGRLQAEGALSGLAMGAALGVLVGLGSPGGHWERVYARPAIAVGPARGGVALALHLRR